MDTRRISIDELAGAPIMAGGELFGSEATIADPVVVVDLDIPVGVSGHIAQAAQRACASEVILVGTSRRPIDDAIHPVVSALDLTYAPEADHREVVGAEDVDLALAGFLDAVRQCPTAALVVAQVIRVAEPLDPIRALDVESFAYSTLQGGPEFGRWLAARRAQNRPLPPPALDPVLLDRVDDTLRITLNRPERRNAYGTALRDALVEALRVAIADATIGRLVLDGAGTSFCAGGDLDEFGHMPDATTAHLVRTRGGAGRLMAALADRVEVRLHGHCVGAGIEIPSFATRVVATPDTHLLLPEVSMGLIPGAGGTVSVPRRIGRWRALHLFVTGADIDASQALSWGLIDAIED
ncbi:enoyl-CoA hydratase/isomerase family protein [Gordonia sp. KTR9]|uniref:enoyl-CoA hydratase/isomerase family protein n=1 Tax=Gordonia sp. KTR9 TaxID=337191 RepID=UPI00027DEA00|nr:enoyl-CoA hydratase/isomerase family protein [Gordonia sp. KTR9]AFR49443.1 Enoyl-CoA hydratase / carnithine racemase [Gordonia sp. KTR9]